MLESIEAGPSITDLTGFPCQDDPATVYPDDYDIRLVPTATNFFCRETLPPSPDVRQPLPTDDPPRQGGDEVVVGHANTFK
eukprot:3053639-Pyramimonas_sp.AAC.1